MADIFLSYASEDREHARRIAVALEAEGWSVFWDRRIPPGQQFAEYIERRLKDCRVVVVLWSSNSVSSRWVWREARHATKREPPALIPAMISDAAIPFEFDDIQAADLTAWLTRDVQSASDGLDELLSAIDALAPRPQPEPSTPSRVRESASEPHRAPALRQAISAPPSQAMTTTTPESKLMSAPPRPESSPRASTPEAPTVRRAAKTSSEGSGSLPDEIVVPLEPLLTLLKVPAGPFLMGSDKKKDSKANDDELWPGGGQGTVHLREFYIGRSPVTVAQFKACVAAKGISPSQPKALGPHADHPVVYVSWSEALQYCQWLEQAVRASRASTELMALLDDGWHVSLPSEAEWEKAARGTDGRTYPWGEGLEPNRANYGMNVGATSPVGGFPRGASPYGVEDMSGNVWEWTRSLYNSYPYDPSDGREDLKMDGRRVVRGGSFFDYETILRAARRGNYDPGLQFDFLGFRVVVSRL